MDFCGRDPQAAGTSRDPRQQGAWRVQSTVRRPVLEPRSQGERRGDMAGWVSGGGLVGHSISAFPLCEVGGAEWRKDMI